MFGKQLLSFIMALYIFSSEFQSALAGSTNFNLITLGFYCHWLSSLRPKRVSNLWSKTTPRLLPNQIPIRLKSQLVPMSPSPTLLGQTSNLIQLSVSLKDSISPKGIWFTIVPFTITCPQKNPVLSE